VFTRQKLLNLVTLVRHYKSELIINDIVETLDLSCLLFADDMKVYSMIGCHDDALRLQDGNDDNLFLNYAKCKVFTFH
jgi:hypothetical protein